MIEFTYSLFTETEDFPVHLQYGFHEQDLYRHLHADFSELVIVLDGRAQHLIGTEQYPLSKGDVFVVGSHTEHGFAETKHLTICNIMFRAEAFSHIYDMKHLAGFQAMFLLEPHLSQRDRFLARLHLSDEERSAAQKRIDLMMQEYTQKRAGWQDMVLSGFHALCVMLSRCYRTDETEGFLKLADVIAYIENHFTEHISVPELTALSGYSERHFLRLFHDVLGTAPNRYITNLRIAKAKHLLKCTALSVGEIAWRCGFGDRNYFTRAFRGSTAQTPSEYRKKNR